VVVLVSGGSNDDRGHAFGIGRLPFLERSLFKEALEESLRVVARYPALLEETQRVA
jgi:hypothetical protein